MTNQELKNKVKSFLLELDFETILLVNDEALYQSKDKQLLIGFTNNKHLFISKIKDERGKEYELIEDKLTFLKMRNMVNKLMKDDMAAA